MADRTEPLLQLEIDIRLTISRPAVLAGVAAAGLYVFYSNDSTRERITSTLRNIFVGFVGGRIDPEILRIFEGSLRVILRCYSLQSFLQFLDDYETGRVKERLNEEFSKIGIGNVNLEIANEEEIKEKKKNLEKESPQKKKKMSLWEAARKGDLDGVKTAVESGADIEERGGWDLGTGLHWACREGHVEIVKYLLDQGADVGARVTRRSQQPLHWAAIQGDVEIVKLLLQHGADIDATDTYGWTPLHLASYSGKTSAAEFLIQSGAKVNSRNLDGCLPIHYACSEGHLATVKLLVSKGSDFTSTDNDGHTPLHLAIEYTSISVADYLLGVQTADQSRRFENEFQSKDGKDLNPDMKEDFQKKISPWDAARKGDLDEVKAAVKSGADIGERGGWDLGTGLHWACREGHVVIVKYLLDQRADVGARVTRRSQQPLHWAAFRGDLEIGKLLIQYGADIDATDVYGWTPLHLASYSGKTSAAEFLIQRGAKVNSRNLEGCLPIHYACREGHLDTVKLLVTKGSDFTSTDNDGHNPLHYAIKYRSISVAHYLLDVEEAGIKQQQPPADLQTEELPSIAKGIASIWTKVALRTKKFDITEIGNMMCSRHDEDPSSKALTMLMKYKERGGTRATLAKAIKEDKEPLSEKVQQGYFIDGDGN